MEPTGRTVVMAAFRASLYELGVDMGDRMAYALLPPTYIVNDEDFKAVDDAIKAMHADGTLLKLSQQYYGLDLTSAAGTFDFSILNQW